MMKPTLSIYRAIMREVRLLELVDPARQDITRYITSQFKNHKLTDAKYCRANEAALSMAKTYLTLLQSSRKSQELQDLYSSKGECTTEQAANMVGLNLPKMAS